MMYHGTKLKKSLKQIQIFKIIHHLPQNHLCYSGVNLIIIHQLFKTSCHAFEVGVFPYIHHQIHKKKCEAFRSAKLIKIHPPTQKLEAFLRCP